MLYDANEFTVLALTMDPPIHVIWTPATRLKLLDEVFETARERTDEIEAPCTDVSTWAPEVIHSPESLRYFI